MLSDLLHQNSETRPVNRTMRIRQQNIGAIRCHPDKELSKDFEKIDGEHSMQLSLYGAKIIRL